MHARRVAASNDVPIARETEVDLARRWRAGDRSAGCRLVVACLPFVTSIALEYRRWGIPIEDIVQQGRVGLLRAAAKFDPSKECRLTTYAAYWIRAEIREYVVRAYRVVRLGTTKAEKRAVRAYRKASGIDATALAEATGMARDKLEWLLPLLAGPESSLDADPYDRGPLSDRIAASSPTPEDEASARERAVHTHDAVARALGDLTERERTIVRDRLMAEEPRTLQDLGEELGVSKERVRQIEERVREKLRARLDVLRGEAA
jgi:RNA polymerase sigma-32 factor